MFVFKLFKDAVSTKYIQLAAEDGKVGIDNYDFSLQHSLPKNEDILAIPGITTKLEKSALEGLDKMYFKENLRPC
ncbi:MAG: hypothetical protein HUJ51_05430 [Eggerthellaceae bacterium]|nr:hypothetical protein [Eggerthellaceae bacterium]